MAFNYDVIPNVITALGSLIIAVATYKKFVRGISIKVSDVKEHALSQVVKANSVPFSYIQNLPIPAWLKSIDGKYLWINEAYCLEWGASSVDFEGKDDYQLWGREVALLIKNNDSRVIVEGVSIFAKELIPDNIHDVDGPSSNWNVRKFPVKNPEGRIVAIGGVAWKPWDCPEEQVCLVRQ